MRLSDPAREGPLSLMVMYGAGYELEREIEGALWLTCSTGHDTGPRGEMTSTRTPMLPVQRTHNPGPSPERLHSVPHSLF
uniref:Uncharacterized protein n=1 Tax=Knipowitschia caucasica TaxID=637954 RepID=A0AAV2LMM7_KNICA